MTYSYDPTQIRARGKDQMRFELGDTQTEGGAETCALADEEYEAMLAGLKEGKRRGCSQGGSFGSDPLQMQYQVNTKIDVLQYDFGERAGRWQKMYDTLKKQALATASIPTLAPSIEQKPPYFHSGMQENHRAMHDAAGFPFRKRTT